MLLLCSTTSVAMAWTAAPSLLSLSKNFFLFPAISLHFSTMALLSSMELAARSNLFEMAAIGWATSPMSQGVSSSLVGAKWGFDEHLVLVGCGDPWKALRRTGRSSVLGWEEAVDCHRVWGSEYTSIHLLCDPTDVAGP